MGRIEPKDTIGNAPPDDLENVIVLGDDNELATADMRLVAALCRINRPASTVEGLLLDVRYFAVDERDLDVLVCVDGLVCQLYDG